MTKVKVHHIYSRSLSTHGGPSKSLRRFRNHADYFEQEGIEYSLFTQDDFAPGKSARSGFKGILKRQAKVVLNRLKPQSLVVVKKIIEKRYFDHSEFMIESYLKASVEPADVYVFSSAFDCHFFLKHRPKSNYKVVLIQHNSGVPLSMLEEYYPSIKGTEYRQELYERLRWTYGQIDRMIFIAENGLKTFRAGNHGISENRLGFFHNGIDDYEAGEEAQIHDLVRSRDYSKYRFICAGTINNRKAQYLILEAFSKLPTSERNMFHFTFLGDGPDREKLLKEIKSKKWQEYFSLPGAVSNVPDYLRKSNLYILMSKDEGLPISIIEAEKMGLPIVGTIVAGIPEMIDHEVNGFLLNPNPKELTELLRDIKNHDLQSMGLKSIDMFKKKFTFSSMLNGFIRELKKV